MNRLIRAEWYKLLRSNRLFWFILLVSAVCVFWMLSGFTESLKEGLSLGEYLQIQLVNLCFGELCVVLFIVIAGCMTFGRRLIYYEVMNGSSPFKIINSRIILYGGIFLVLFVVPISVAYIIIGINNGVGAVNLVPFLVSFYVLFVKSITLAVLLVVLFKGFLAPCVFFGIADFGMAFSLVIQETTESDSVLSKIAGLTTVCQKLDISAWIARMEAGISNPGDDKAFMLKVIISTVVEVGIVYFIAYRKLKNRRYK